jgi:8-oxo-dGTP diphosphatase
LKRAYSKLPLAGVGAVIVCSGKILLVKRGNEPAKGKWSIPGGLVELGETSMQAVMREAKEETGLEVCVPELLDVMDAIHLDERGKVQYQYVIADYFVKMQSGKPEAASDAAEVKWVRLGKVEGYDLTRSFRDFFVKNRAKLEKLESRKHR